MRKINKYLINGKSVPGVTSIIGHRAAKPLLFWYGKNGTEECNRISNEAREFGEKVHNIVEAHIGGQKQTLPDKLNDILENFKLVTKSWEWLESEKVLLNKKYKYGGTADAIALIDGVKTLIDIKTGNLYDGQESVQLVAYLACLPDVKNSKILHLDKDSNSWEVLDRETKGIFKVFLAFKQVYDYEIGFKL